MPIVSGPGARLPNPPLFPPLLSIEMAQVAVADLDMEATGANTDFAKADGVERFAVRADALEKTKTTAAQVTTDAVTIH